MHCWHDANPVGRDWGDSAKNFGRVDVGVFFYEAHVVTMYFLLKFAHE